MAEHSGRFKEEIATSTRNQATYVHTLKKICLFVASFKTILLC